MTRQEMANANNIFGPSQALPQGKSTRKRPDPVENTPVHIPPEVYHRIRSIAIVGDVFFVNNMPFLMMKSRKIRFSTIQHCTKLDAETLFQLLRGAKRVYDAGGLAVEYAYLDGQFEPLRDQLASIGITLNTTSANEHVLDAERHIRTLKEHVRAVIFTTPFRRLPTRMVIKYVKGVNTWINTLPAQDGVS